MSLFEETMELDRIGENSFRRQIDRTWWGWNGQFGGYVLGITLEAFRRSVTSPGHREVSLSMNFLRRVPEGRLVIEVDVVRVGRTITNLAAAVWVDEKQVATALALFGSDRDAQELSLLDPPDLTVPTAPPTGSPIPARAMDHLDIWEGPSAGKVGWMRLSDPGGADERFGMFAADGMMPMWMPHVTAPQIGGTVDFTAHFREPFPQRVIDGSDPLAVVLHTARAHRGYVDEDSFLWSPDGRLLMQSRQTRYAEYADIDILAGSD